METTIILLCLKIFFVRILDVSMGTCRTLLIVKGKKFLASMVAFVEVSIWFAVVREALNTNQGGLPIIIAYAGGFSVGTLLGSYISEKFIGGNLGVTVITDKKDADGLVAGIREAGYAVTVIEAKGKNDEKYMLYVEIEKRKLDHLDKVLSEKDPDAFVIANESKFVRNGFIK